MKREELERLPKIELHCHLDGSLSRACLEELLDRNIEPFELQVADDCRDLAEYLEKFELPLQCLQTAKGLEAGGYDFIRGVAKENVRYVEVRFAPLFSVNENLNTRQVIEAVLAGLERGSQEFGVSYQVITCAMRHHTLEENQQMLAIANEFLGKGVCGADLAGNEAAFPMKQFVELFEYAKQLGLPFTIHAGECGNVENIIDAVSCGAARIGHGIAMRGQKDAKQLCRNRKIGIEMCPISNLQTKAVEHRNEYPIREFIEEGLLVTINTDNRTVSNTSITKELEFIQENCGVTDDEVMQILRNAVAVSFADEAQKQRMSTWYC